MPSIKLLIHGTPIYIQSQLRKVIRAVAHDFSYFKSEWVCSKDALHIVIHPSCVRPMDWIPLYRSRRSQIFCPSGGEQRVCFFNSAWVGYHFNQARADIFCDDPAVAFEACYFVILSYVGERLDIRGLHRIHGLGLARGRKGAIVLAPSGGGKSTLLVELLKRSNLELISDDTPVLNHTEMLCFPQRIALRRRPAHIGANAVRIFRRYQDGKKYVIGANHFKHKVRMKSSVHWFVLAKKTSNQKSQIKILHRFSLFWPILKWLVIGYEIPQIWELYLRPSPKDTVIKSKILLARMRLALKLIQNTRLARLSMSTNPRESAQVLDRFLSEACA